VRERKILFISHDGNRTGAPFVLLHFLKWFREHANIPFMVLLRNGGPLEAEFAKLAPTMVFSKEISQPDGVLKRAQALIGGQELVKQRMIARLKKQYLDASIGLIYSNTITNGEVLEVLSDLGCPVISHIHELEFWIRYRTDPKNIKQVLSHTHHYIAGAEVAKENLIQNHGVHAERIDVIYECIPTELEASPHSYALTRQQLGIPPDALVVGAAGTTDWRKAPDLFVQLANSVHRRCRPRTVHFIWVGGETQGRRFEELWHDVRCAGLQDRVHFVGARTNYLDYLACFDVFTLVSREDCFPLVMLEAGLFSKPIVCFDAAGGAKEFVETDCGFVIPYLDVEAMAEKVTMLLKSTELRSELGRRAAYKARDRHDVAVIAPRVLQVIERFFDLKAAEL
jgi:glycosyltransferase involved in cell wall biosynthesis